MALASSLGEAFEYVGNREFREGDSVRGIDWRATARLDFPVVREYREEYFLRVAVVLDTQVHHSHDVEEIAAFERAVSICASVGDYMARQDYIVDIFAAGPRLYHLTAGRSLAYLDQILDILACVEETTVVPFGMLEPEIVENLSKINALVCVFLDWDAERQSFVDRLVAEGAAVKVIIVRDQPCTLDPSHEASGVGRIPVISKVDFEGGLHEI